MPKIVIPRGFKKRLRKKPHELQGAILEAVERLGVDPFYPSLKVGRVQGTPDEWEARADRGNRLTFMWERGVITLLNHCHHDIVGR